MYKKIVKVGHFRFLKIQSAREFPYKKLYKSDRSVKNRSLYETCINHREKRVLFHIEAALKNALEVLCDLNTSNRQLTYYITSGFFYYCRRERFDISEIISSE